MIFLRDYALRFPLGSVAISYSECQPLPLRNGHVWQIEKLTLYFCHFDWYCVPLLFYGFRFDLLQGPIRYLVSITSFIYHFARLFSVKSYFSIFEYDSSGLCCLVRFVIGSWLIRPELISNAMQGKTNIGFIFQHRQSKIISKSQNSRLVNSGRMPLAAGIDSAQKANPVSIWSHRVPKCEILWLQRSRTQIFGEIFLPRRSWRDFWSNCSLWLTH